MDDWCSVTHKRRDTLFWAIAKPQEMVHVVMASSRVAIYCMSGISGRGAGSNTPNRFETIHVSAELDESFVDPEGPQPSPKRTQYLKDHSRTILTTNNSPDIPFDASINPYRGCEHGCIYCYARPTHEYLGFSGGLDFESKILVKENAPELLREKLLSKSWKPIPISISGVTDCYQPIERKLKLTRRCIEVLREFQNPFTMITKNHLITRDIDLLSEMAELNAVGAMISVTTLDNDLCSVMEPRTSRPQYRLQAIEELSKAGIPVGVMVAPVIPGLTDHEMPSILDAAAQAGAKHAAFVPVRLPHSVLPLFTEWLETHFPDRKEKVLNRIMSMRDGKLNDPDFGSRMRGSGVFADQLRGMFKLYSRKYGLNQEELELSTAHFQRPGEQMRLF